MELITLFWLIFILVSFLVNQANSFIEYMDIHYHESLFYQCFENKDSFLFYTRGHSAILNIIIFIGSMILGFFAFGLWGIFISFFAFGAAGSFGKRKATHLSSGYIYKKNNDE